MTTIMIGKALATVTENETLTSGMINAKIKFEFSADWHSGISRTAIFTAGDVTKVVLDSYWENNVCSIPQECLEKSDEILMVGVYGADNANTVAIPTVWATVGKIRKGYEGYEDVSTGTLPIWAQVQSAAAQAAKDAQTAATAGGNMAKSWAVGGTGTREGEDTDNAKYWAKAAQGAAGGGVASFNGRSGAVVPKSGDYTAAMVEADSQGTAEKKAAEVQSNLNAHATDTVKHVTAEERAVWNAKMVKSTKVNTTLSASGWSTAKKYTLSNSNITATSAVELLPRENNGITQAQLEALSGAMIVGGTQAAGSIQLVALGDKPTTDIPVTLIIRRDL